MGADQPPHAQRRGEGGNTLKMDAFDYAFTETLGLEGGYSDVPGDRGGRTKYGITESTFRHALERGIVSGVKDVKDLNTAQAKAIYKVLYWFPLRLQSVRNTAIAAEIFDTAVNTGIATAALITQLSLDYLGEDIEIDGILGTATLGLVNKWCVKDPVALFKILNGFQFIHYCSLVNTALIDKIQARTKSAQDQRQFAQGWTKRIQEYRKETA